MDIVKQPEKGASIARIFFAAQGEGRSNAACIATDDNKVMRKIGSKDVPVFRLFDYISPAKFANHKPMAYINTKNSLSNRLFFHLKW